MCGSWTHGVQAVDSGGGGFSVQKLNKNTVHDNFLKVRTQYAIFLLYFTPNHKELIHVFHQQKLD